MKVGGVGLAVGAMTTQLSEGVSDNFTSDGVSSKTGGNSYVSVFPKETVWGVSADIKVGAAFGAIGGE